MTLSVHSLEFPIKNNEMQQLLLNVPIYYLSVSFIADGVRCIERLTLLPRANRTSRMRVLECNFSAREEGDCAYVNFNERIIIVSPVFSCRK